MSDQDEALDKLLEALSKDEYWNPVCEIDKNKLHERAFLKHLLDTLRTLDD